ncbi:MAG: hypothetical protein ACYTX0_27355 [Nostoc sp.]
MKNSAYQGFRATHSYSYFQVNRPRGRGTAMLCPYERCGNTVRLRIFVGWVERSETQQTLQLLGFVPQPNLHIFIFWA